MYICIQIWREILKCDKILKLVKLSEDIQVFILLQVAIRDETNMTLIFCQKCKKQANFMALVLLVLGICLFSRSVMSSSFLRVHGIFQARLLCPWDFPPGSSVHGIFQARILEWVAIYPCTGFSRPRDQTSVSCIGRGVL